MLLHFIMCGALSIISIYVSFYYIIIVGDMREMEQNDGVAVNCVGEVARGEPVLAVGW
jgi:hypothetical protein